MQNKIAENENEQRKKFIQALKSIKNYWLSLPDKTTEEIVDGVLFSTLVMIDGDSSTNDFHSFSIIDRETNTRIDCGYLHDLYLNLHGSYFKPKRKMPELEKKSLLASNSPLNGGV